MKINFEDHGLIALATLSGDLTLDSVDAFRRGINDRLEKGVRDFVLILDDLKQIDSAGLESFLWLQERSADRRGQVRIVGASEIISTILRITRLDRLYEHYNDVTEAVRSLR